MILEDYKTQRENLINEATSLTNEDKFDEANAKMDEINDLDEKWTKSCEMQANIAALSENQPVLNVQNLTDSNAVANVGGNVSAKADFSAPSEKMTAEEALKSDEYKTAWAKAMMNKQLSDKEREIMHLVNEDYTHTTENTPVVIPESVAAGIWHEIDEMHPLWADISKTSVKGKLTIIKGTSSSDAQWYDEETETEDGKEEFGTLTLDGCELARSISVTWKEREMAINDFITYIQDRMAERMGAALGYGVATGAGVVENAAPEPKGIITALKEEDDTPQVVTYTEGNLQYQNVTEARGKILSGYNAVIYANNWTIWNVLANVVDNNNRPIFISDPTNGGVLRALGCVVKEEAAIADGDILFFDASTYRANVNRDISVQTEEHVKKRYTDYCGYAIVDGAPLTTKGAGLLTVGE